jgi:hypothetical protein
MFLSLFKNYSTSIYITQTYNIVVFITSSFEKDLIVIYFSNAFDLNKIESPLTLLAKIILKKKLLKYFLFKNIRNIFVFQEKIQWIEK